jgi:ABC-type multidrug transport system ATPase subunit
MTPQIHTEGLRKRYGDAYALDGFDLSVPAGSLHGLLGPNGAGKTTAVRVLSTLLRHDGGTARVAGFDVATESAKVLRVSAPAEPSMLTDVVRELAATELSFADVALRHPTLDEVFLELTGVAR